MDTSEEAEAHAAPRFARPVAVLATYDERANVERLLPQLLEHDPRLQLIVVDDGSPDGTASEVRAIGARHPGRVHLIERDRKLGYGSALVAGFRRALELEADAVISMDADFSHDPAAVPALLAALDSHDVVIGSRYVDGIRILNWSVWRLVLSIVANRYVGLLLGLGSQDCTSGFRAYRGEVLARIPLEQARSNGYAFLVEVLDLCVEAGFRVCEVPIVYEDRQHGRSKMDRGIIFEAAWKPWALLARRWLRRAASLRGSPATR